MSKKKIIKENRLKLVVSEKGIDRELTFSDAYVTVGQDIENSISVSSLSSINKIGLFKKDGKSFNLIISPDVSDAEFTVLGVTLKASDLIKHNLLKKVSEKSYVYKVVPGATGKVFIGDVSISFCQIEVKVPPPPPKLPKPIIPREFRRRLFLKEDLLYVFILIISISIHSGLAYYFEKSPRKKESVVDIKKIPKRFAKLILGVTKKELKEIRKPKPEKKVGEEKKEEAKKEEMKKEEAKKEEPKKEEPKKEPVKKESPKEDVKVAKMTEKPKKSQAQIQAEKRAKRREKLKSKGVLALLAGKRFGGKKGGSVSNFIRNKDLSQNITKILKKVGGLQHIKPIEVKQEKIEKSVDIDNLIAKVSKEAKSNVKKIQLKERKKTNMQKLFDMEGSGSTHPKRSRAVISGVVQTFLPGLKFLYKRELRKDPTLEGKIVIRFTILADGKVANCEIAETTMNNRRFESSLLKRVRRWMFEPIEEGEVTINYPFVFSPVIAG